MGDKKNSLKGKENNLACVIWIEMGGYVHNECDGLSNANIEFKSFLRGVNGCMRLHHDWFRKAYGKVRHVGLSRSEKIYISV